MGEKQDDRAFEDIAGLIREDKERALERFRKGDFDQKIRARIAAVSDGERRPLVRRLLVPVSVVLLFMVAAGALLLLSRRRTTAPLGGPGRMMTVLGGLPGISELALPKEAIPPATMPTSGAARTVWTVLTLAIEQKEAEEKKSVVPTGPIKVPRLSLEKKMEILFKDKVIERVLVSILRKSEEA
jgi:hypothetical protein